MFLKNELNKKKYFLKNAIVFFLILIFIPFLFLFYLSYSNQHNVIRLRIITFDNDNYIEKWIKGDKKYSFFYFAHKEKIKIETFEKWHLVDDLLKIYSNKDTVKFYYKNPEINFDTINLKINDLHFEFIYVESEEWLKLPYKREEYLLESIKND